MSLTVEKWTKKLIELISKDEFREGDFSDVGEMPKHLIGDAVRKFELYHQKDSKSKEMLAKKGIFFISLVDELKLAQTRGSGIKRYQAKQGEIDLEIGEDSIYGKLFFDTIQGIDVQMVLLLEDDLTVTHESKSDEDGDFDFEHILPGKYFLQIRLSGEEEIIIENLEFGAKNHE